MPCRATHWQNTPSSPTSVDDLRYDGAGTRIEQCTVSVGTTTTTYYLLGGQEEVQIFVQRSASIRVTGFGAT